MPALPEEPADLRLVVPAVAAEVTGLRRRVTAFAADAGFDPLRRAEVALAVGEACANVVTHAYAGRAAGTIVVHASAAADGIDVHVVDRGRGLVPRADSPGLGLGLPLISALASAVEFHAVPGGGTEVRMHFGPQAAASPTPGD